MRGGSLAIHALISVWDPFAVVGIAKSILGNERRPKPRVSHKVVCTTSRKDFHFEMKICWDIQIHYQTFEKKNTGKSTLLYIINSFIYFHATEKKDVISTTAQCLICSRESSWFDIYHLSKIKNLDHQRKKRNESHRSSTVLISWVKSRKKMRSVINYI